MILLTKIIERLRIAFSETKNGFAAEAVKELDGEATTQILFKNGYEHFKHFTKCATKRNVN